MSFWYSNLGKGRSKATAIQYAFCKRFSKPKSFKVLMTCKDNKCLLIKYFFIQNLVSFQRVVISKRVFGKMDSKGHHYDWFCCFDITQLNWLSTNLNIVLTRARNDCDPSCLAPGGFVQNIAFAFSWQSSVCLTLALDLDLSFLFRLIQLSKQVNFIFNETAHVQW